MKVRQIKIGIKSWEENKKELAGVFRQLTRGKEPKPEEALCFRDISTFRRCPPPERMELLWAIVDRRPQSVRPLATLVGRQLTAVRHDLEYLASVGLVEFRAQRMRTRPKVPVVPYDRVELSVELRERAA